MKSSLTKEEAKDVLRILENDLPLNNGTFLPDGRYITKDDCLETLEIIDKCRCNNCMNIYDQDIKECPKCKTDEYLMQPFVDRN